jgi:hypothetical protein
LTLFSSIPPDFAHAGDRGKDFRGDHKLDSAVEGIVDGKRMFKCATFKSAMIGYLPISMFGNAYT